MNILSIEKLGKSFGIKPLFESVTFGLDESDRVGVIGLNGSGKTTLLRIIAGVEAPDTGRVVIAKNRTVAYLPQNPTLCEDDTVLDAVFPDDNHLTRLLRSYERS